MDLGIKGRSAIVTGGSRGIGKETARRFLEEGVRVTICGRNAETLDRTRAELADTTGGEIHAVVADTTRETDIARLVDMAKQCFGGVDILVNNAGQMFRDGSQCSRMTGLSSNSRPSCSASCARSGSSIRL